MLSLGWIFFILAGNKPYNKSLDEFEFWQVSITDFGVSCPWASEKSMNSVVTTLGPSFLIESSSFLQATRKPIVSRIDSKFSRMRPGTYEWPALERLGKFPYTYNGRNVVTTLVNGSSSFLHTIRTTMKAWMRLNFVKVPLQISELAALERLKN